MSDGNQIHLIKYGQHELRGNWTDRSIEDLPSILEGVYDIEIPDSVEIYVDGDLADSDFVLDNLSHEIEIRVAAGKKGC